MSELLADRLSVEVGDPGYDQYESLGGHKSKIHVYLDGVEQKECVTADRLQGWVRRVVTAEGTGEPETIGDAPFGWRLKTEVVYGRVEFKIEARAA